MVLYRLSHHLADSPDPIAAEGHDYIVARLNLLEEAARSTPSGCSLIGPV
jgi:hypothetical protein